MSNQNRTLGNVLKTPYIDCHVIAAHASWDPILWLNLMICTRSFSFLVPFLPCAGFIYMLLGRTACALMHWTTLGGDTVTYLSSDADAVC